MHADKKHLADLFKGVKQIREVISQYCLAPDLGQTSLDDLTYAFEQMYDVHVEYYLVPDLKDNLLRGMYIRRGNKVQIYLDETLSPPWLRYVAVKELCQLILADPEYMTLDPGTLIELLIYEETEPLDGEAPLDLVADAWAKRAAHEFLFPHEMRAAASIKLQAEETTVYRIAQEFGVPEHVVEWTLRDSYADLCNEIWAELNGD